jgi:hypothetical protein
MMHQGKFILFLSTLLHWLLSCPFILTAFEERKKHPFKLSPKKLEYSNLKSYMFSTQLHYLYPEVKKERQPTCRIYATIVLHNSLMSLKEYFILTIQRINTLTASLNNQEELLQMFLHIHKRYIP